MSVKKHTLWNIVGAGLPLLVAALVIPSLVRDLGIELFGLLSIIWTLIGYFSLFDLGLGRAITHNVAAKFHVTTLGEMAGSVKIGLKFTLYAGLFGSFVVIILSYPLSHSWLSVSKAFQHQAYWALLYSAFGIPFVALSSGTRGVLEGLGQFYHVNMVRVFQGVSTFAFPLFSIYLHGPNLEMIALWLVFSRAITLLIYAVFIKAFFGLHWRVRTQNVEQNMQLLQFGSWMTISNIVSPLLVYLDRFVISGMYGASMIAYYTVPFEILSRMLILPGALGAALFPRLSYEYHSQREGASALLMRAIVVTGVFMAVLCGLAVLFYMPVVTWWISKDFALSSVKIATILSLGVWLNSIGFIIYTALQAKIGAKQTALLHSSELIIYIPMLYFFTNNFGLEGAAAAWTIRVAVDTFIMYILFNKCGKAYVV